MYFEPSVWGAASAGVSAAAVGALAAFIFAASKAAVNRERTRLRRLVFPQGGSGPRLRSRPDGTKYPIGGQGELPDEPVVKIDSNEEEDVNEPFVDADRPVSFQGSKNDSFVLILIEYYAHGLTQARRNSLASLTSAGVGIVIVIAGAAFALFWARTSVGVTAAVVISVSGAITNTIGVLFHRQANRTLSHMESQTQHLREDMRSEQETWQAIQLLSDVSDPKLRDRLRAGVVLRLAQAELPQAPTHEGVH